MASADPHVSVDDLIEENAMLRENIKALKTLFTKEQSRSASLEAKLAAREGLMENAMRTMADEMTGEIEELRRRLQKYEPEVLPPGPSSKEAGMFSTQEADAEAPSTTGLDQIELPLPIPYSESDGEAHIVGGGEGGGGSFDYPRFKS